jgi:hypothetical protein
MFGVCFVANPESVLMAEIMLAMSERGLLVWRQHVGTYRPIHGGAPIKMGLTGMSDIGAIVPRVVTPEMVGTTIGLAVQVEVKTATGRESEAQATWGQVVRNKGGVYVLARSVDDIRIIHP